MFNVEKARKFIQTRGSALEKERLRCLVTGASGNRKFFPIEYLQNADRGFALKFRPGNPSCINDTGVARMCLEDLNLLNPELAEGMIRFILSRQNRDGIFVDPYETLCRDLPLWMEIGTFRFAVYYTSFSVTEVLRSSCSYQPTLEASVQLLKDWQRKDGSLPGYLHNTWLAAGVYLLLGTEMVRAEAALEYLDQIPEESWEHSQLIWALEALVDAGLTHQNRLVEKWLYWLKKLQNANGSFTSEDDDRMNPDITLHAIRILKKLNLLTKEEVGT